LNAWHWVAKEDKEMQEERRMTMNELFCPGAGLVAGIFARRDFLRRPLVDGSQGRFVQRPALWFLGSLLLRMSIALAGFYFVGAVIGSGCWRASLDLSSRDSVVTRLTRTPSNIKFRPAKEASHAP
jgi:hypothetical protein